MPAPANAGALRSSPSRKARQILRVRRARKPARSAGNPGCHIRWLVGQAFGSAFLLGTFAKSLHGLRPSGQPAAVPIRTRRIGLWRSKEKYLARQARPV